MILSVNQTKTYHLAEAQPISNAPPVVPDIMNHGTFSWIESDSEPPFLPLHKIPISHSETRAVRLRDIQSLQILPQVLFAIQFRYVLRRLTVIQNANIVCLVRKRIMRTTGGELINADDLLIRPVHNWNDRERVRIEISICVLLARVCSEDKTLEEAPVFVCGIETTVWPRLKCTVSLLLDSCGRTKMLSPR